MSDPIVRAELRNVMLDDGWRVAECATEQQAAAVVAIVATLQGEFERETRARCLVEGELASMRWKYCGVRV